MALEEGEDGRGGGEHGRRSNRPGKSDVLAKVTGLGWNAGREECDK